MTAAWAEANEAIPFFRRSAGVVIKFVLILALAVAAAAQPRHWNDLSKQITGRRVTVTCSDRRPVTGALVRMDGASMRVATEYGPADLPRGSVTEIRVHADRRGSGVGVLIGAAVGTALGLMAGHGPSDKKILSGGLYQYSDGAYADITPKPKRHYGVGAAVGASAGGIAGWLLGRGSDKPAARYQIVD